jgi:hypothetical protein
MIFGLLSLANLAQNDVLQFHPFTCEWQDFILHGWVKFHCKHWNLKNNSVSMDLKNSNVLSA